MVTEFANTEFKLTDDLPPKQRFSKLHVFEVVELVNYGLAGGRAPQIGQYGGTHLEPEEYHKKMCEEDTVIIDVRNHYEANVSLWHVVAVSCIALQLTVFGTFIDWTIWPTKRWSPNDWPNDA